MEMADGFSEQAGLDPVEPMVDSSSGGGRVDGNVSRLDMSPWHHIPREKLTPALRETLTILNRRWVLVWLLTLGLGVWLPLFLNAKRINDIQKGRQSSVATTCAATNAVVLAGQATLRAGGAPLPPRLEASLRALGYPTLAQRQAQAAKAARAYSLTISRAIAQSAHRNDLVSPDGSLRCDRLRSLAQTSK
jgi:hypothetical protein